MTFFFNPRLFLSVIMGLNVLAALCFGLRGDWWRLWYFLLVAALNFVVAYGRMG